MSTAQKVIAACEAQSPDWKQERPNRYRGSSPLRPGSDSNGFVLVIHDDEHGAYFDHASNDHGSLYDLAQALGIELPTQGDESPTRTYTGLADYALAHGLTSDDLKAAGWFEAEVRCPQHERHRPALQYPVRSGKTTHMRTRFIDGLKPKYVGSGDGNRTWYGLERAVDMAKKSGNPLVIVNGEISTIAAQKIGIPACSTTTGEKANGLAPALLAELKRQWTGQVIVANENDPAGEAYRLAILKQLAPRAGYVDLGMVGGQDIADFIVLHGDQASEAFWNLKQHKPEAPTPDIAPLSHYADRVVEMIGGAMQSEMQGLSGIATGIQQLDSFIDGLCPGEVTVILGATGMGKSTLVSSIASNAMVLPGYIETTELSPEQYILKLAAAITGIPVSRVRKKQLIPSEAEALTEAVKFISGMTTIVPHKASTPEELRTRIQRAKNEHGIQWAIVDSINALRIRSDSYFAQMTEASTVIRDIAQELQLPFLVTSQIGRKIEKPRPPRVHDAKGSGGIEEDASYVLGMYYHEYYVKLNEADPDPNHPPGIAYLHPLKSRWGDLPAPFPVKFIGGARFENVDHKIIKFNEAT